MSTITLEAELRTDLGKGASRRLRRLEKKIPAILYGGNKKPQSIHLLQNKVTKAMESESIYSSAFNLKINGKDEQVILKAIQRHPYKPLILHLDLQRVSDSDVLVKLVPLHFLNADEAKGVKAGGMVQHTMMHVEVRCKVKDLPEFIEVDLIDLELDEVLHLSDLKLPKNVQLAVDPTTGDHDHPVVSIHVSRAGVAEEAEEAAAAEAAALEADEKEETGREESAATPEAPEKTEE